MILDQIRSKTRGFSDEETAAYIERYCTQKEKAQILQEIKIEKLQYAKTSLGNIKAQAGSIQPYTTQHHATNSPGAQVFEQPKEQNRFYLLFPILVFVGVIACALFFALSIVR